MSKIIQQNNKKTTKKGRKQRHEEHNLKSANKTQPVYIIQNCGYFIFIYLI